ncbi:class E sortase [Streptomyces sp. NPDC059373]
MAAERRHFGDTAEFAAAVEHLTDPLSDPLPGQVTTPAQTPVPAAAPVAQDGSPWFRQQPEPQQPQQPASAQPYRGAYESASEAPYDAQYYAPAEQQLPAGARILPRQQPVSEAERATARRRAAGAPGETAAMPLLDPGTEAVPDSVREPAAEPEPEAPVPPPDGGRAARRKAAQEATRRGGRGRRAAGAAKPATEAAGAAEAAEVAAAAPRSRMEARRAAKAAKESPAVIASRVLGEIFITIGVLMLLFVTYQLWWTNVLAHQEAGGATKNLEKQWDGSKSSNRDPGTFSPGEGFAIIYLPKLDVKAPIAEGTDKHKVLDKGMVGHYSGKQETAMPWDKTGNFALAAHRNTHGEPFRYINKLVKGDKVVVETESTYYTYEVTSTLPSTSPANTSVINPIPTGSGFTTAGRYITLTTCTPEFTSKYRLIVWGKMVEERPRSEGKPDALVQ